MATQDDAQLLFDGRNAEAVRCWSLDRGVIEWPQHLNWLKASLRNPQRLLLIAEADDGPVGVLRYDVRGFEAEVSGICLKGVSVSAGAGRCWQVVARSSAHTGRNYAQSAQVLPNNRPSLNVFHDARISPGDCVHQNFEGSSR